MPTRLDGPPLKTSRERGYSRPPPLHSVKSTRGAPVTLSDLPDEGDDEWEPENLEPALTLSELNESIASWEAELKSRGRAISGRTM